MPVDESTVYDAAGIPPKLTATAPVKFDPLIFTIIPLIPNVGVNEVIVGATSTPIIFFKMETVLPEDAATVISGLPSLSRSEIVR